MSGGLQKQHSCLILYSTLKQRRKDGDMLGRKNQEGIGTLSSSGQYGGPILTNLICLWINLV